MKKLILFLLCMIFFLSCSGTQFDRSSAFITSQDFVKENLLYPKEVKFNSNYTFEEYGKNEGTVLAKFTAKNAFSVRSEYVYKIWIKYKGGDWADKNNWTYSLLEIENISTGERQSFRP